MAITFLTMISFASTFHMNQSFAVLIAQLKCIKDKNKPVITSSQLPSLFSELLVLVVDVGLFE